MPVYTVLGSPKRAFHFSVLIKASREKSSAYCCSSQSSPMLSKTAFRPALSPALPVPAAALAAAAPEWAATHVITGADEVISPDGLGIPGAVYEKGHLRYWPNLNQLSFKALATAILMRQDIVCARR